MDPAPPSERQVDEDEKPEWFSGLDPHARRLLIVVCVVALVAGLLGGFLVGFKVEQNLAEPSDSATKPKPAAAQKAVKVLNGVVTEKATDSITINSTNGFRVTIPLPATLVVQKVLKATPREITTGSTILEHRHHGQHRERRRNPDHRVARR